MTQFVAERVQETTLANGIKLFLAHKEVFQILG